MEDVLCYHGKDFEELLKRTETERKLLIDGIVPEQSMIMGYATDGLGKSTLLIEAAIESANGLKVFGALDVERPLNHIYILGERDPGEPAERVMAMMRKHAFTFEHFALTDKLQGFDLQNEKHHKPAFDILMRIADEKFKGEVDIVDYDPIYALCGGKLKEDEDISTLRGFLLKVQRELNSSSFIMHHENRGTFNIKTKKREGADFYGNKFISAMCQGVFHITQRTDGQKGTYWKKEKDTYKCLLDEIPLLYDDEFMLSTIDQSHAPSTKKLLAVKFINECYDQHAKFSLNELVRVMGNVNSAKKFLGFFTSTHPNSSTHPTPAKIRNCNPLGQKALYEVIEKLR